MFSGWITPPKRSRYWGSTGSIGRQALEVCEAGGFAVYGLSAHQNEALLEEQVRRFRPPVACISDPAHYESFRAGSPTSRSK